MSVSTFTPDLRRILDDLARRIGILERRVVPTATTTESAREIIFSYAGTLAAATSPPVRVLAGGNMTVLAVTLGTAGTSSTVLDVLRNGTSVGTVTITSGTTTFNGDVPARFAADSDLLAIEVTTAGTGAADMTAAARFT